MHVHYLRTHIHRDTCIYTQNTYISHIDTYTHISIHTPTCEHMHINADTYRYTKTHTYMHTHICTHTFPPSANTLLSSFLVVLL